MATTASLSELFGSLGQSVTAASEAASTLSALTPPEDGLSLLDVKNELLLSYLEHVAFLVLLKLRRARAQSRDGTDADAAEALSLDKSDVGQAVVKKLVELRLYLEKGVRPLEEKLRYQIEKSMRAAEDVERAAQAKKAIAEAAQGSGSDSGSDSEDHDDDDDEDDNDDGGNMDIGLRMDDEEAASRPNRAAFVRPASTTASAAAAKAGRTADGEAAGKVSGAVGVYRPPRIAATLMPGSLPTTDRRGGDRKGSERRLKSATMDEFIADELSTAPMAELSIGTNIAGRGRHMKTSSERQHEEERREYEERNFVRLPKESKKDRAKRGGAGGGRMAFGGEEWHGLGEGVDRINRLTQRKSGGAGGGGGSGGVRSMLEKSRKRGIDTTDGPRGSGMGGGGGVDGVIGGRFKKRLRHARDK